MSETFDLNELSVEGILASAEYCHHATQQAVIDGQYYDWLLKRYTNEQMAMIIVYGLGPSLRKVYLNGDVSPE